MNSVTKLFLGVSVLSIIWGLAVGIGTYLPDTTTGFHVALYSFAFILSVLFVGWLVGVDSQEDAP